MIYAELTEKYQQVVGFVEENRINEAMDALGSLSAYCTNRELSLQLEKHRDTYRSMLTYSFELGDDPEKEQVLMRMLKSILELNDDIREDILMKEHLIPYYNLKQEVEQTRYRLMASSSDMAENLAFKKEVEYILSESGEDEELQAAEYRSSLLTVFQMIWLTDKFRDAEIQMVGKICRSKLIPWYDKSLLVSSLTISLLRHFDVEKVNLLFEFFEEGEMQVWQRALIGLFMGLFYHDYRLNYYPEIINRLEAARETKKLEKNIEAIVIQFLKALETETVTKKIREEILPEMMKMKSTLEEKLNLEDILSSKGLDDENPDWETVFEDTPDLYSKIEEFSNMQIQGSDVFLSAFAMLKRFPFFSEISNWFLPFHKDNEEVKEGLSGQDGDFDVDLFTEGLERSSFLCNSDKYSFCLNVRHMPDMQKSMMMELFNMELKAMNELADNDEMLDDSLKDKSIYTQYLQDLYRFFKLHPWKNQFDDVFDIEFDFENSNMFNTLIKDRNILRNIGEFYFQKNHFERALRIFEQLCAAEENAELHEKTGFSYQKMGDYNKALEHYHKAELFEREKPWVIKKIAYCSRKTGDSAKALKYYLAAERLEPDNLLIQSFLGHTLMDREDYEGALKYYFKVEYHQPENHKVHRPIAWCSFVLGKFDHAEKYFRKVIEKEGNRNDFMNLGHVLWCQGNRKEAIENYRKSLEKGGRDFEWFSSVMEEDSSHLYNHGIKEMDIPLMVDYMRMGF
ncbi:tetratricopeptide repeat protein [Bacteroidota bacterium]